MPVLVAVAVLAGEGVPLARLDLHDGGVWLTATDEGRLGRWNTAVEELDGGLVSPAAGFDVLQDGTDVLLVEPGGPSVVDPATVTVTGSATAPGATVGLGGGTVSLLEADGDLWVRPVAALAGLDTAVTPADHALGAGGAAVATASGAVLAVDAAGAVTLLRPGAADPQGERLGGLAGGEAADPGAATGTGPGTGAGPGTATGTPAVDALTAVGDVPVALSGRTLRTLGGTVELPGDGLVLQAPGPAAGTVLVASRTALLEVSLEGLGVRSRTTGGTGTPAAPVRAAGCGHGAWAGPSGTYLRLCGDDRPLVRALDAVAADADLRLRVNHDLVVLNDARAGRLWLPETDGEVRTPDWAAAVPEDRQDETDPERTDGERTAAPDAAACSPDAPGPVAVDDDLGVRPGRTTVLPVLDNDSASTCGVLAVSQVDPLPAALGVLEPVAGGRALQVTVPAGATGSATVPYTVTDGRGTSVPSTATLRLTVRGVDEDTAPEQLRTPTLVVEQGGRTEADVLAAFRDPEGDVLQLVRADVDPAVATAVVEPAGTLALEARADAPVGTHRAALEVSDGRGSVTGELVVEVRARGGLGVAVDPLLVRTFVDEPVLVEPLAAVRSWAGAAPRLAGVEEVVGLAVRPDLAAGTFTARAARTGSWTVPFTVTAGGVQATGVVRVDVVDRPGTPAAPVAVPDVVHVPPLGEVTVDPLANDVDPDGEVLVLRGVEPEQAGDAGMLRLTVLEHRLVRVQLRGDLAAPVRLTYDVSDGRAATQGEITVVPVPAVLAVQPPTVPDVTVQVRAGGVVTVPVLADAHDPDGDRLTLRPTLAQPVPEGEGLLFVAGDALRYQAPARALTTHAVFVVRDADGQETAGRLTVVVHASDAATKAPPAPRDLTARVLAGETVRIPVPLVGIDPDGDGVTLLGQDRAPADGRVTAGADWLEYTALPDAAGTDTFTYAVEDWVGQRSVATVRVGVSSRASAADRISAGDDAVTVRPGQTVEVRVLANDVGTGGAPLALDPELGVSEGAPGGPATPAADAPVPGDAPARTAGRSVVVRAPDRPTVLFVTYTVRSGRGGVATGLLTVTVDPAATAAAPVAADVVVPATDTLGRTEVEVDVLGLAQNPSGPLADLAVTVPRSVADVASVDDRGRVVVQLGPHARTVPYLLTNTAAAERPSTWAFVTVPALGFFPPVARPRAPALRVAAGAELLVVLDEQVQVAPGRRPSVADAAAVQAVRGTVRVVDGSTVAYTPAPGYAGAASITVPVTDSTGPTDADARRSAVTLPVTVVALESTPPTFAPDPLEVPAGARTVVDLALWVRGPEGPTTGTPAAGVPATPGATGGAASPWTFALAGAVPDGLTAALDGTRLSVTADAGTSAGTTARLRLALGYGRAGTLPVEVDVRVVASTQPLARVPDREVAAVAGREVAVPVLDGAFDPFPGQGLQVVGVVVDTPGAGTVRSDARTVTVVPAAAGSGTVVVRFRVRDVTRDPQREVQGRLTVVVRDRPDAPGAPAVLEERDGAVVLSWTAPDAHGDPVTGYRVVAQPGGAEQTCEVTTCTVTGLTNGTAYTFTVAARNGIGLSDPSTASAPARPDAVPAAPGTPVLVRGDRSLVATWSAPATTGSPVTGYAVEVSPAPASGPAVVTVAQPRATIGGLVNGTAYTVRVRATNGAPLPGPWSTASAVAVPAGVPAAPVPTATRGETADERPAVTLAWTPSGGNGDPVTAYEVRVDGGAPVDVGPVLTWTLTDARLGQAYVLAVRARNGVGVSEWATATGEVWSAPGPVTATAGAAVPAGGEVAWGAGAARWTWSAPTSSGTASAALGWEVEGCTPEPGEAACTRTGLVAGPADGARVRAVNDRGLAGPWTELPAVAVVTAPQPPVVELTPGGVDEVLVRVVEGADGGTPVTERAWRQDGGAWRTGRPPASLSSGAATTTVEVRVGHARGASVGSATGAPGRATVPAERTVTVAESPGRVAVGWDAGGDGGAALEGFGYRVVRLDGEGAGEVVAEGTTGAATTRVDVPVPGGGTVEVQVRARNGVGWGPWPTHPPRILIRPAV
ncbi:Ig-like domain-containing protein [Cellulomonas endophytica]|uniref:Ig-like domain-containing protein n=1 Tax=Cellulomonas endophytica TaxID=2494735 RepID=UPI0010108E60|nr:fibronectin type III domain-containing protein [Cellulomonas endophytica]